MFQSSSAGQSLKAILGRENQRGVLGAGASEATRRLFGLSVPVRQVLEQHTLFGVYSRTMPASVANALASRLESGKGDAVHAAFRGHRRRRIPRLATTCLRSCDGCIQEDMDHQGFASWRVLHLLPSIGHCPYHGTELRDEGGISNNARRRWPLTLPGEHKSRKTNAKASTLPISDGYCAYLHLWKETFGGDLIGIAPDLWMLVMDAVVRRFGTLARACEVIEATIRQLWDVSVGQVAAALDIADGELFVNAELDQRVQASYVASRLVIVGALDHLQMSPPRRQSPPHLVPLELSQAKPFGSWLSPRTQAELRRYVMDANFPPALYRALAGDVDVYSIDASLRIDRLLVRRFATTLPGELLETMSKEQTWSNSSWLMKEMRRREVAWSRGNS
ncbi:TniQ family protein [Frateuria hangzhouensis]|uniref:TniQ family protein n=1 Tax=Frateuria hangzhouensis TaxID=2995589 RepID=UPI002260C5F6|nr:TniQ family protein [Frateuria sp. STR12]MCX7514989.1 TniQ family protein [Frateuria sp. STR12]